MLQSAFSRRCKSTLELHAFSVTFMFSELSQEVEKLYYHRLGDCLGVQKKEQARVHAMLSTSYTIFKMQLFPCYEFGYNRGTLEPKIKGFDAFISRDT